MSLDIFAYAVPAGETHGEEIHRWSGHSWFKQWWFDMVAIEQGVDKPRAAPMVTNAELDRFETVIVNGDVPRHYSFDDWKDHDLAFVAKARAALAAGKTVVLEHPVLYRHDLQPVRPQDRLASRESDLAVDVRISVRRAYRAQP